MYKKLNLQRYTEDTGRWFKLKKKYVYMYGALEPTPQPTNLFRYEYEFILDAKLHVEEASPPPANPPPPRQSPPHLCGWLSGKRKKVLRI